MILYTLQPEIFVQKIGTKGVLIPDLRRADAFYRSGKDIKFAYHWMRGQMKQRLFHYSGRWPIWAYTFKPDLRLERFRTCAEVGTSMVRLKIDVPEDRILLSHIGDWHFPLNGWYLPSKEEESWFDELADKDWDAWCKTTDDLEADKERLLKSWERIFNIEDYPPEDEFQACVDQVFQGEVLEMMPFITRRR